MNWHFLLMKQSFIKLFVLGNTWLEIAMLQRLVLWGKKPRKQLNK